MNERWHLLWHPLQLWNDMRVSDRWQNDHFWMFCCFKSLTHKHTHKYTKKPRTDPLTNSEDDNSSWASAITCSEVWRGKHKRNTVCNRETYRGRWRDIKRFKTLKIWWSFTVWLSSILFCANVMCVILSPWSSSAKSDYFHVYINSETFRHEMSIMNTFIQTTAI